MHLFFFLIVIVALSCGSLPPADIPIAEAAGATVMMVAAWILLSHVGARMCAIQVRRENIDPVLGADLLEKQLGIFRWLSLGISVLCLAGFGLARTLDSIPLLEQSMFLKSLILVAPGIAMTVGTWSAEHCYGAMLGYTDRSIRTYVRAVWHLFRGGIGWLVAPVLLLLGFSDLIGLLPISSEASGAISAVMIILFVALGLPMLIRRLFKTQPLSESDDAWVRDLMNAVGLGRTGAVRWDTGGRTFNAMVAGFVPPLRTLLLSDRLVDDLPREQIAMVVLHEAAHLRRRHVPLRMLSILPAWGCGALTSRLMGEQSWSVAAGSVVGILMTMIILRLVAYRTEYDADVQACELAEKMAGSVEHVPVTYEAAAESLSSALMRVTFDHPSGRKPTWLHPGVADRVDWMRRQREVPANNRASAGTMANPA